MMAAPALEVRRLAKRYPDAATAVLRGVDLQIASGECLALIGRSGAGKSTLARILVGLETADAGEVLVDGLAHHSRTQRARQAVQLVWQQPLSTLSPYLTVREILREPLDGFALGAPADRDERARALADTAGLPPSLLERRPHEISGGEAQRVAIARALAAEPRVIVLDEPLAALDGPRQVQLTRMLSTLSGHASRAMFVIAHDLTAIRALATRVAVLHDGVIVDTQTTEAFFASPRHEISRAFVWAWPALPFTQVR